MVEGETTPPPLLHEADLIALMDKHGIGKEGGGGERRAGREGKGGRETQREGEGRERRKYLSCCTSCTCRDSDGTYRVILRIVKAGSHPVAIA